MTLVPAVNSSGYLVLASGVKKGGRVIAEWGGGTGHPPALYMEVGI